MGVHLRRQQLVVMCQLTELLYNITEQKLRFIFIGKVHRDLLRVLLYHYLLNLFFFPLLLLQVDHTHN